MVVVTGATSFIGSATVRLLLGQGETVCAVVRPGSVNLRGFLDSLDGDSKKRLLVRELDLRDIGRLPELLCPMPQVLPPEWDVWLHAGWDGAGSDNRTRRDVQQANVAQSLEAVRTARKLGCRRFIFTGSQAEYGICHTLLRETQPCRPVSEYGKAKADFLNLAKGLCKSLKMEYIHTRIFSIYGPGDHPWSLVNSCLRTWREGGCMQLGACTQQWNFLYIDDAAEALCHFLTEGENGIYNVAGTDTRPLRSYIEEMYRLCGSIGSYDYGSRPQNAEGAADLIPDITKLLGDTGWHPKVPFAEGIRRIWSHLPQGGKD